MDKSLDALIEQRGKERAPRPVVQTGGGKEKRVPSGSMRIVVNSAPYAAAIPRSQKTNRPPPGGVDAGSAWRHDLSDAPPVVVRGGRDGRFGGGSDGARDRARDGRSGGGTAAAAASHVTVLVTGLSEALSEHEIVRLLSHVPNSHDTLRVVSATRHYTSEGGAPKSTADVVFASRVEGLAAVASFTGHVLEDGGTLKLFLLGGGGGGGGGGGRAPPSAPVSAALPASRGRGGSSGGASGVFGGGLGGGVVVSVRKAGSGGGGGRGGW